VYADPKLFATLDPTTRRVVLPDGWAILLTDTVGFIRNLPTHLVAAFRATLEETIEADFLIHVVDASHPHRDVQRDAVIEVLEQLGAGFKPTITVFNKADLIKDQYALRELVVETENSVYISARTAEGVPHLMDRIVETMKGLLVDVRLCIPTTAAISSPNATSMGGSSRRIIARKGIYVEARITHDLAGRVRPFAL